MYTCVCVDVFVFCQSTSLWPKHRQLSFRKVYLKFKLAQKSKRKGFLNFVNELFNFVIVSIWKNLLPFNVKKLKLSSLKDVWLKLAMAYWFRRRKFSKFVYAFLLFRYYLPLVGEGRGPSFESPLTNWTHWFWRRRKYEKFTTTTTTTTTDNGQILIRKAHLGLWLRWAKNTNIVVFIMI